MSTLPPGYEIRRDGNFLCVHDAIGRYLGLTLDCWPFGGLRKARRIAWDDFEGRGKGSVVERG